MSAFHFDLVRAHDLEMLRTWLLEPHVAEWWGEAESIEELHEAYVRWQDAPKATRAYIVSMHNKPLGFIQSYVAMGSGGGWWEDETDPGVRGIDQFLANVEQLNQGIGRSMIRVFVEQLFADPAVTLVQTDPSPRNKRAIRCYSHAGFHPVREIVTPDGPALLMHCSKESLRGAPSAA